MHLRKPSPTSVIAGLALFIALGGTALASRYLITSTRQIKPSVLRRLKGNTGENGKQGSQGVPGPQGVPGARGVPGAQGGQGPQGVPGAQGAAGRQGVPGPQGRSGPASAWATVAADGLFVAQVGFPGGNTHPFVGVYCIPAPAGKAGEAVALTLTLSTVGFVFQEKPEQCGAGDFQVGAVNVSNTERTELPFNILVP